MRGSPATDAAAALLDEFVRLGVEHIVLSPGSRSQALALVAARLHRDGRVVAHVRHDERVAGFTALGIARESGRPVAVIVTSGTAVANLLPAVAEAHHAGVPLLLLTADRPPELRGVGANQTTAQPGIFGAFARFAVDAPVPSDGDDPAEVRMLAAAAFTAAAGDERTPSGPAHLNLPYREPLSGDLPSWWGTEPVEPGQEAEGSGALYQGGGGVGEAETPTESDDVAVLRSGPRTIVVAGADAGPDAEIIAHAASWPLVAEITSGARYGRRLVHGYRELLREHELGGRVERAIVVGHPTLSREVTALLSRDDVEVVALRGPGEPLNLNGATRTVGALVPPQGTPDLEWLGAWMRASAAHAPASDVVGPDLDGLHSRDRKTYRAAVDAELAAVRRSIDRTALVDAVWRASWPHDRLMFGSSRLVRVADAGLPGKKVPVHANRGLAGIDGTVATATGIAIASQQGARPGVTRVLLGDLTLLHDVSALQLPADEQEPRIQVIVGNDGGGTIFDGLEVAGTADEADLARVMYTPQHVRLEHLALAYGWEYHRVTTVAALEGLLTSPAGGRQLIEVPLAR